MDGRRIAICVALVAAAVLCGCAGYFHYHPIKTVTEKEEAAAAPATRMFTGETFSAPVTHGISAAPVADESFIK
ncbi:MAG: hypothetical protein PHN82_02795 [bacterium]|nr:hypothetical protein [bacterium]